MTVIYEKEGNIFTTEAQAIAHGVNLEGVMGAGIAKTVREFYPNVYQQYRVACKLKWFGLGENYPVATNDGKWILNLATQRKPGPDARLKAVKTSIIDAYDFCNKASINSIAFPQIGAGIGGLKWDDVAYIIAENAEKNRNIMTEVWTFKP